jgi:hypothetical protein
LEFSSKFTPPAGSLARRTRKEALEISYDNSGAMEIIYVLLHLYATTGLGEMKVLNLALDAFSIKFHIDWSPCTRFGGV